MGESSTNVPKTRVDFARILKNNDDSISKTIDHLEELFKFDSEVKESLRVVFVRIRDTAKKSKKYIDSLDEDWWSTTLYLEAELKKGAFLLQLACFRLQTEANLYSITSISGGTGRRIS